ncbi:hypothetical protein HDU76_011493, partial [Blyttiomyces sp. JEL0837]
MTRPVDRVAALAAAILTKSEVNYRRRSVAGPLMMSRGFDKRCQSTLTGAANNISTSGSGSARSGLGQSQTEQTISTNVNGPTITTVPKAGEPQPGSVTASSIKQELESLRRAMARSQRGK